MVQTVKDFQKFSQFQTQSRLGQEQERDKETLMSTFTKEIGSQLDENFSQEDNDIPNNDVPKKKERE